MNPHQHRTNNMMMRAPSGMTDCIDVPATMVVGDTDVRICTFWRPSSEELVLLNAGHTVCLHVYGKGMPPVWLSVEGP